MTSDLQTREQMLLGLQRQANRERQNTVADTETKHDGYAVFNADGNAITWAVGSTKTEAINGFIGGNRPDRSRIWSKWKRKHSFTVRPVTITEV